MILTKEETLCLNDLQINFRLPIPTNDEYTNSLYEKLVEKGFARLVSTNKLYNIYKKVENHPKLIRVLNP